MLLGVYERGSTSWLSPSPLVHKVWGQKKLWKIRALLAVFSVYMSSCYGSDGFLSFSFLGKFVVQKTLCFCLLFFFGSVSRFCIWVVFVNCKYGVCNLDPLSMELV